MSAAASSVSVDELVRALDRKSATLPAEIAAFIAFSSVESMLEQGPRDLSNMAQVRVSEQGTVVLSGAPCEEAPAARSLHRVLVRLLEAAGRNLPPALQRLLERPEQDVSSLHELHDSLEATLVPLNRTASRRVLARFARDASHPLIEPDDVDAALNSLLGEERPANDVPRQARSLEPDGRLQVDLLEGLDLDSEDAPYQETSISVPAPAVHASTRPSMAPRESMRSHASQLEELGNPSGSRKLFIGFALLAVAVLIVIIAVSLRDERERDEKMRAEAVAGEELAKAVSAPAGNLVVHVSEPNAQVLRYVGTAPVNVEKLPVGVPHEFVATADGHHPARVLVPANAEWETTPDGAKYEVALQLTPSERNETLELGPSRFAGGGGAASKRGTIRVVTTPRAARVYQLIGFSPEVTIENVPLDAVQELLVYREGFTPVAQVIEPSDFKDVAGKRKAELTVQLAKHKR